MQRGPEMQTFALEAELVVGVLLFASLYGAFNLTRVVCGGLLRMRAKFAELADTLDISRRAASPRLDEFGLAAVEFDRMLSRIESAIVAIDKVSDLVGEIASATDEQSRSLGEVSLVMPPPTRGSTRRSSRDSIC